MFELMKEVCKGIEERYYFKFDAIGHEENHVHILIRGAPRYSPSRIMQICKSILAIQIFKKFPKLKEEELWGDNFGVMEVISILLATAEHWNKLKNMF